jgi:hypothetical protein
MPAELKLIYLKIHIHTLKIVNKILEQKRNYRIWENIKKHCR